MKKLFLLQLSLSLCMFIVMRLIFHFSFLYIVLFGVIPLFIFTFVWFWWFRKIYFFRDPLREPPKIKNAIVSPADGTVMYIYEIENGNVQCNKLGHIIEIKEISKTDVKNQNGWLIGIYMTPFDVHFNYSPIQGKVDYFEYYRAKINLPMVDLWEYINFIFLRRAVNLFSRKFHFENERMTVQVVNDELTCLVVLIADKFVNKISKFFELNDNLKIGQKMAFISRGSQVDLFIPKKDIQFKIKIGQRVKGCKTLLAVY